MSGAPAHGTKGSAMLGRSGLPSSSSSTAPPTLSPTSRVTSAVFALPVGQQQRTQRSHRLAMGSNGGGDGLTVGPGPDETIQFPFSGQRCGRVSTETATTAVATESVPQKRSLGEGMSVRQPESGHSKRQRVQQVRALGAEVFVNHDNTSPLQAFVAPPLPSVQQQQARVEASKPPQKAIAPYQATSAVVGSGENKTEKNGAWGGVEGEGSNSLGAERGGGLVTNSSEEGRGGTVSPSLTTVGHVVGGASSPPSSSFSSSSTPATPLAPAGAGLLPETRGSQFRAGAEQYQGGGGGGIGGGNTVAPQIAPRAGGGATTGAVAVAAPQEPSTVPRPALRTNIISGGVPNNPSSGGFNAKNIVEIWGAIAENWSATVAAATTVTSVKQQEPPAKNPCKAYARESLDAALRDQGDKLSMLHASIATASAASQRLEAALTLMRNTDERLRACWLQCLQPAQQELEWRLREWNSCANDMPLAVDSARKAEDLARCAEQLYASAHQRAVRERQTHDASWTRLLSPRLAGEDYGALVAAEHRARAAYGMATSNLESCRQQMEIARAAATQAAELVDVEAAKRFLRDDDVGDAKRRYGVAKQTYDAFEAQLRAAQDKERVARDEKWAACIVCGRARTLYDDAKRRTKRTLGTYQLFVFGREGDRAAGSGVGDAGAGGTGGGGGGGGGKSEGRRLQKRTRATVASGELPAAHGAKRKGSDAMGGPGGAGEGDDNEGEGGQLRKRARLDTPGTKNAE